MFLASCLFLYETNTMKFVGTFYNYNNKLFPVTSFVENANNTVVYEVLRLLRGEPVFFHEHLKRLKKSVNSLFPGGKIQYPEFKAIIKQLVAENRLTDINIRIELTFSNNEVNCIVGMIPSVYPTDHMFLHGVDTDLIKMERPNPNIKVFHTQIQEIIKYEINRLSVYELFLVNNELCITEGSRSNLFFVQNNSVFTAPEKDVLSGITRLKVMEVIRLLKIPLVEAPIFVQDIANFEGCFLTGTSPTVLPVRSIGNVKYQTSNDLIRLIREDYLRMMYHSTGS